MKTLLLALLTCGLLFPTMNAEAQSKDDAEMKVNFPKNKGYVQLIVGDEKTSQIILDLHKIVSISLHTYMLNSKIPILELTIDSLGNNSVRIYTVITAPAGNYVNGVKERMSGRVAEHGVTSAVSKQYPHTTHAHSIEYSAMNTNELRKAYSKLIKAWTSKKGDIIIVK